MDPMMGKEDYQVVLCCVVLCCVVLGHVISYHVMSCKGKPWCHSLCYIIFYIIYIYIMSHHITSCYSRSHHITRFCTCSPTIASPNRVSQLNYTCALTRTTNKEEPILLYCSMQIPWVAPSGIIWPSTNWAILCNTIIACTSNMLKAN